VLRQGQGMHGSFGRGDTMNFMAAIGPDFKAGYVDPLPVSNADVGMTISQLMGLRAAANGGLIGRVISEALPNGIIPKAADGKLVSKPAANGLQTVVKYQRVLSQRYFDAAGFPGRTVGLEAETGQTKNGGKINPRRPGLDRDLNLHPDIEHLRQLRRQRHGCGAYDGGDQRHQGAVAALLAPHLARDPFQHVGIDARRTRRRPAFDRGLRRQRNRAWRHRQA